MTPIRKFLAIAGLALPVAVSAQSMFLGAQGDAAASQQQINQEIRVQQGLDSGSLNAPDAAKLERAQDRLGEKLAKDKNGLPQAPSLDGRTDLPRVGR